MSPRLPVLSVVAVDVCDGLGGLSVVFFPAPWVCIPTSGVCVWRLRVG